MTDCLGAGDCLDLPTTLLGTDGDDLLITRGGADLISAGSGDDTLIGGLGKDTLQGADGDDLIVGGFINSESLGISAELSEELVPNIPGLEKQHPSVFAERLSGGAGNDRLVGGSWNDEDNDGHIDFTIYGGELLLSQTDLRISWGFNNEIWGGEGSDSLFGENGFDTLGGGAGDDVLFGFGGVDIIYGGSGNDWINGGSGDPEIIELADGSSITLIQTLFGGDGNDRITGGDGVDYIYGGSGEDRIFSEGGNDRIWGGEGNDTIFDSLGNDTMTGGEGNDVFNFTGNSGQSNVITDFNTEEDTLNFLSTDIQADVDRLISDATEQTVEGVSGLLIEVTSIETLFLIGLTEADIGSIVAVAALVEAVM